VSLQGCRLPSGKALPNISIQPGKRVAFVGTSGSGKTSVLRLIAGLVPPDGGEVRVADQPLGSEPIDHLLAACFSLRKEIDR
jgi:ABC-type Fe3+/spermidine/putrescine transport system ATPase subunit